MDFDLDLHNRAKALKPQQPLSQNQLWVGLIPVEKANKKTLNEAYITWVRSKNSNTILTLRNKYQSISPVEVVLLHGEFQPPDTTTMRELRNELDPNDDVIILKVMPMIHPSMRSDSRVPSKRSSGGRDDSEDPQDPRPKAVRRNLEDQAGGHNNASVNECSEAGEHQQTNSDSSHTQPAQAQESPELNPLRQLIINRSADHLEQAQEVALDVLGKLKYHLSSSPASQDELQAYLDDITDLEKNIEPKRTIIGIVGVSGSGKSSLINALLDESVLLPTSSMEASTAVVTEILWNQEDDLDKAYRVAIEFISKDDWEEEMRQCLEDIFDQQSVSTVEQTKSSKQARHKLLAVYPNLVSGVQGDSVDDQIQFLLAERPLTEYLDRTLTCETSTSKECHGFLQDTIDSKISKRRHFALWPLIKRVQVFTKSPILKTGIRLVDMPGFHDSNAARAAAAEKYMQDCSMLWIIASMERALTNDTVQTLLDRSLRRRLVLDGMLNEVVVVCTKIDDIKQDEVISALELSERTEPMFESLEELAKRIEVINDEIARLKSELSTMTEAHADRVGQALQDIDENTSSAAPKYIVAEPSAAPLGSQEGRIQKILSLSELKQKRDELKEMKQRKQAEIKAFCIGSCCETVKSRFHTRVQALMDEYSNDNSMNTNANVFEPDEVESPQSSIPVFCVSSQAYQQLNGRLRENHIIGFDTLASTGIPSLQRQCQKSTDVTRLAATTLFLNGFEQFILSLLAWTKSAARGPRRRSHVERERQDILEAHENFKANILKNVRDCVDGILKEMACYIASFAQAHSAAMQAAPTTARAWSRAPKGLTWQTYRAVCRRQGHFATRHGDNNFNHDLANPWWNVVTPGWHEMFSTNMPEILHSCTTNLMKSVLNYCDALQKVGQQGYSSIDSQLVHMQSDRYIRDVKDSMARTGSDMRSARKSTHASYESTIRILMVPVYDECQQKQGKGTYDQMRECMRDFVLENKSNIFVSAKQAIVDNLDLMSQNVITVLEMLVERLERVTERDLAPFLKPAPQALSAEALRERSHLQETLELTVEDFERTCQDLLDSH